MTAVLLMLTFGFLACVMVVLNDGALTKTAVLEAALAYVGAVTILAAFAGVAWLALK